MGDRRDSFVDLRFRTSVKMFSLFALFNYGIIYYYYYYYYYQSIQAYSTFLVGVFHSQSSTGV